MLCLDTNIIIYIAHGMLGENIVGNDPIVCPSIVHIESLGYPSIKSIEEQRIRELLATLMIIPLTDTIIEIAIRLRQGKKMSLGDAIVAATALESGSQLWTANSKTLSNIDELGVFNPFKKSQ